MKRENRFQFTNRTALNNVVMLNARMSDFSYAKHAHEEYSIGITLRGRQDFFCGSRYHKSLPGSVIMFNPEMVHDGHSGVTQDLEYVMLYVHPDEISPLFHTLGYQGKSPLRLTQTLYNDPVLRFRIYTLVEAIEDDNLSRIEYESALYLLAQTMVRHHGSLDITPSYHSRSDKLLLTAKEYIVAHLGDNLSIDDISAAANLSKFHFIRMFRAQFGITPHQYVLNCRINHARKVLQLGKSATAAAQASGFADASHLNRNFKKVFGMTPKQFQSQLLR